MEVGLRSGAHARERSRAHNTTMRRPKFASGCQSCPEQLILWHCSSVCTVQSLNRLTVAFDCHLYAASPTVSAVLYESGDALVAGSALVLTVHGGGVVLE